MLKIPLCFLFGFIKLAHQFNPALTVHHIRDYSKIIMSSTKEKRASTDSTASSANTSSKKAKTATDTDSTSRSSMYSSVDHFPTSTEWRDSECGTLLYLYPPAVPTATKKIAGFDIDDTIIKTKSGKTFATNDLTDWQLWSSPQVKQTLTELSASDGYRIVFFTNQEGISKGKVDKKKWTQKVTNVIEELGLKDQVTVLASLSKKENDYRKPHIGMWRFLCQHLSPPDAVPEASGSMYVGDAAGRPKRSEKKKDFSCTDYKFALNIGNGIEFHTPEQLFFKSTNGSDAASLETSTMGFQPKVHWSKYLEEPFDAVVGESTFDNLASSLGKNQEVIVIVGSPACGKSSLTRRLIAAAEDAGGVEYERINQDTLKTVPRCVKATKEALDNGKSAIIDNTNRDVKVRKNYIDIAKKYKCPVRCIWVDIAKEESFHLNAYRGANGNAYGERRTVPDMVIHTYYKNMVEPKTTEGFSEVHVVNFYPGPFNDEEHKTSFYRYTM